MTRSLWAASVPGSGSLNTVSPAGTVTDAAPPKDSRRLEPWTSSAPCFRSPAYALAKVTGCSPKALDSRIRRFVPPTLVRTISR